MWSILDTRTNEFVLNREMQLWVQFKIACPALNPLLLDICRGTEARRQGDVKAQGAHK